MRGVDTSYEKGRERVCEAERARAYVVEVIKCQPVRSVECLTGGFTTCAVSLRQPFSMTQSSRCCDATLAHTLEEYTSLCFNTLTLLPHCCFLLVVTLDFVSLLSRFSPPVPWKISSYPLPGCLLGKLI